MGIDHISFSLFPFNRFFRMENVNAEVNSVECVCFFYCLRKWENLERDVIMEPKHDYSLPISTFASVKQYKQN